MWQKRVALARQMALAWVLRGGRVTSVLTGASRLSQWEDCVNAPDNGAFSAEELSAIDAVLSCDSMPTVAVTVFSNVLSVYRRHY